MRTFAQTCHSNILFFFRQNISLRRIVKTFRSNGLYKSTSKEHVLSRESSHPHQIPEVHYLDRFKIEEIPCGLKSEILVCRVNHDSEIEVGSSLQVAGASPVPLRSFSALNRPMPLQESFYRKHQLHGNPVKTLTSSVPFSWP